MAEESDKEKKLREIQERLAEIQGKTTSPPAAKAEPPKNEVTEEKPAPIEETSEKAKEKSVPEKPKEAPKPKEKPAPIKAKKEIPVVEKVEVKKPEKAIAGKKENGWAQNKVKAEGESARPEKSQKASSNARNKILSIVSLSITLLVASYIVYTYAFEHRGSEVDKVDSVLPDEPVDEVSMVEEIEAPPASESESPAEEDTKAREEVEEVVVKDESEKPVDKTEKVRPESSPVNTPSKGQVPGGVIISYSSNSSQETAGKNVEFLKSKGFKANFYYMPDKDANAPRLYKVYVGPYGNESEAMSDFKKVVGINDKAFILRMN